VAWKRTTVGAVLKDKDDASKSYIKFNMDYNFKKGDCIGLESKAQQLASAEGAIAAGKLNPEVGEKIIERINNIADFVRFELVKLERVD